MFSKHNSPFLLLAFLSFSSFAETNLSLAEALQKQLVKATFSGAKDDTAHVMESSHWGPCMSLEVTNQSSDALNLSLAYGYRLLPDDTNVQTMLVTQSLLVRLAPKQKKNYRVYAMCSEAGDAAPGSEKKFKMGKRASGHLLGLAELIEKKKYQNHTAQDAVWCLTDNHDLSSISDDDTTIMYDLRRYVARAKGLPEASIYKPYSTFEPAPEPQKVIRTRTVYSGSLSYSVSRMAKVMVALFDEDNHMKTVYVNNEMQREGSYTYNYELSSEDMNNKKHYLRMFRDGKLEEEISILP